LPKLRQRRINQLPKLIKFGSSVISAMPEADRPAHRFSIKSKVSAAQADPQLIWKLGKTNETFAKFERTK